MVENKSDVEIEQHIPPIVHVAVVDTKKGATKIPVVPPQPQDEWSCPQCTLLNPARKLYCIACFARHPDLTPRNMDAYEYDDGDDDIDKEEFKEEHPSFVHGNNERHWSEQDNFARINDNAAYPEEDPFNKKIRRQMRRKRRMVAGGIAGVTAGAVCGSGALVVAGMVGGVVATRIVSKHRERLKDERVAIGRYMSETKAQATS